MFGSAVPILVPTSESEHRLYIRTGRQPVFLVRGDSDPESRLRRGFYPTHEHRTDEKAFRLSAIFERFVARAKIGVATRNPVDCGELSGVARTGARQGIWFCPNSTTQRDSHGLLLP
jgi:hypothetical protein